MLAAGLAAGTVCVDQATAMLEAIGEIPADFGPACRDEVEKALVEQGNHQSPWQLRLHGEETRANLDRDRYDRKQAAQLARRERHAQERRYLRMHADGYGSVYGSFRLSTTEAAPHPPLGRRRHHRHQQRRAALRLSPRPL